MWHRAGRTQLAFFLCYFVFSLHEQVVALIMPPPRAHNWALVATNAKKISPSSPPPYYLAAAASASVNEVTFTVDTTRDVAVLHRDLKASVRLFIDEWKNVPDDDITVDTLTGGITNVLYTLTPSRQKHQTVIVRVYGEGTSLFVDRRIENKVFFALSDVGVATRFIGAFNNGRVEQFLNATSLTPDQMAHPALHARTAAAVAELHAQHVDGISPEADLWKKLQRFFDVAEDAMRPDAPAAACAQQRQQQRDALRERLGDLRREAQWLQRTMEEGERAVAAQLAVPAPATGDTREWMRLSGAQFAYDVVLCHNDLLSGNILVANDNREVEEEEEPEDGEDGGSVGFAEEKKNCAPPASPAPSSSTPPLPPGKVTLIDFEYAGCNPRAFDVANHWNEFAGFDFNIAKDFPTQDVRRKFLAHYVNAALASPRPPPSMVSLRDRLRDADHFDAFVAGFEAVACKYACASHLFWGVWAAIQSVLSSIDFDFAGYAALRFDGYFFHRQQFLTEEDGDV
jgi:ethanolamine kinase